ncbi:MAG: hypothetical protein N3G20_10670, partial [Verrucomicrobiae bacterium]|nr:hypothetical protein [Verrucomicrobiae bacterium]
EGTVDTPGGARTVHATARITKSDVDTFLFISMPNSGVYDLSSADCLVVDSWVPSGQSTGVELLVILVDEDGEDFIAHTGRFLSSPGHKRSVVPFYRFQRAGWSMSGDGTLNLRRIRDVRIGWGGYTGTEGEQVRFSIAPISSARISGYRD